MNKNEYLAEILYDAKDWIDTNHVDYWYFDEAWNAMELEITGNDNGSYYCSSAKAIEALKDVIFDYDVKEAIKDYMPCYDMLEADPETLDVIVRIALMERYLFEDIKEYWEETKEEELAREED